MYPPSSQQGRGGRDDDDDDNDGGGGDAIPAWLIVVLVIPGVVLFALVAFAVLNQLYIHGWIGAGRESKHYDEFDEPTATPNTVEQLTDLPQKNGAFSPGGSAGEGIPMGAIKQHSRKDPVMAHLRWRFGQQSSPEPSPRQQSNARDTLDLRQIIGQQSSPEPLPSQQSNARDTPALDGYNRDFAKKVVTNIIDISTLYSTEDLHQRVRAMSLKGVFDDNSEEFESVWNEVMAAAARRR